MFVNEIYVKTSFWIQIMRMCCYFMKQNLLRYQSLKFILFCSDKNLRN